MIIDVRQFIRTERPCWEELEGALEARQRDPYGRMPLERLRRFHYLYERVSADLARLSTFAAERDTRTYLEALVARAYAEIHEARQRAHGLRPLEWLFGTLPRTFRAHVRAFHLATSAMLAGCLLGAALVAFDRDAKRVLLPYPHLLGSPADRVRHEEQAKGDALAGTKATGAAWYMQHNTRVAIAVMALGMTWGVGTLLLLFVNGVVLGALVVDYVTAGQTRFLTAWLLPHGSVEIPAILVAGQAGLVLARALIGWGRRAGLGDRLRAVAPDIVTLIFGVAFLLTWAGIVEAFLSQYHEPVIPYALKILLGVVELMLLSAFLALAGRKRVPQKPQPGLRVLQRG